MQKLSNVQDIGILMMPFLRLLAVDDLIVSFMTEELPSFIQKVEQNVQLPQLTEEERTILAHDGASQIVKVLREADIVNPLEGRAIENILKDVLVERAKVAL